MFSEPGKSQIIEPMRFVLALEITSLTVRDIQNLPDGIVDVHGEYAYGR